MSSPITSPRASSSTPLLEGHSSEATHTRRSPAPPASYFAPGSFEKSNFFPPLPKTTGRQGPHLRSQSTPLRSLRNTSLSSDEELRSMKDPDSSSSSSSRSSSPTPQSPERGRSRTRSLAPLRSHSTPQKSIQPPVAEGGYSPKASEASEMSTVHPGSRPGSPHTPNSIQSSTDILDGSSETHDHSSILNGSFNIFELPEGEEGVPQSTYATSVVEQHPSDQVPQKPTPNLFGADTIKSVLSALSPMKESSDKHHAPLQPKVKGDAGYDQKVVFTEGKLTAVPRTAWDTFNDLFSWFPGIKTTQEKSIDNVLTYLQKTPPTNPGSFDQTENLMALESLYNSNPKYFLSKAGSEALKILATAYIKLDSANLLIEHIRKDNPDAVKTKTVKKRADSIIRGNKIRENKLSDEARKALNTYIFLDNLIPIPRKTTAQLNLQRNQKIIHIMQNAGYKREDVIDAFFAANFAASMSLKLCSSFVKKEFLYAKLHKERNNSSISDDDMDDNDFNSLLDVMNRCKFSRKNVISHMKGRQNRQQDKDLTPEEWQKIELAFPEDESQK